jgi:DNA-binding transcriptional MerR regulator
VATGLAKRMRDYVGIAEASRICGLGPTRLRYMADVGTIPAIRDPVGRRLLDRAAVLRLARKLRRKSQDAHQSLEASSAG